MVLLCSETFAADYSKLIEELKQNLPEKWEIQEIKVDTQANWALRDAPCTQVILVGPNTCGFRYYDKNDVFLQEILCQREAIYLWFADKNFDDGWTLLKRIKNRFTLFPAILTPKLMDGDIKVFVWAGTYEFDKNHFEKAPAGSAVGKGTKVKRSWKGWKKDIKKILKDAQKSAGSDRKAQ